MFNGLNFNISSSNSHMVQNPTDCTLPADDFNPAIFHNKGSKNPTNLSSNLLACYEWTKSMLISQDF